MSHPSDWFFQYDDHEKIGHAWMVRAFDLGFRGNPDLVGQVHPPPIVPSRTRRAIEEASAPLRWWR